MATINTDTLYSNNSYFNNDDFTIEEGAVLTIDQSTVDIRFARCITFGECLIKNTSTTVPMIVSLGSTGNSPDFRFESAGVANIQGEWITLGTGDGTTGQVFNVPLAQGVNGVGTQSCPDLGGLFIDGTDTLRDSTSIPRLAMQVDVGGYTNATDHEFGGNVFTHDTGTNTVTFKRAIPVGQSVCMGNIIFKTGATFTPGSDVSWDLSQLGQMAMDKCHWSGVFRFSVINGKRLTINNTVLRSTNLGSYVNLSNQIEPSLFNNVVINLFDDQALIISGSAFAGTFKNIWIDANSNAKSRNIVTLTDTAEAYFEKIVVTNYNFGAATPQGSSTTAILSSTSAGVILCDSYSFLPMVLVYLKAGASDCIFDNINFQYGCREDITLTTHTFIIRATGAANDLMATNIRQIKSGPMYSTGTAFSISTGTNRTIINGVTIRAGAQGSGNEIGAIINDNGNGNRYNDIVIHGFSSTLAIDPDINSLGAKYSNIYFVEKQINSNSSNRIGARMRLEQVGLTDLGNGGDGNFDDGAIGTGVDSLSVMGIKNTGDGGAVEKTDGVFCLRMSPTDLQTDYYTVITKTGVIQFSNTNKLYIGQANDVVELESFVHNNVTAITSDGLVDGVDEQDFDITVKMRRPDGVYTNYVVMTQSAMQAAFLTLEVHAFNQIQLKFRIEKNTVGLDQYIEMVNIECTLSGDDYPFALPVYNIEFRTLVAGSQAVVFNTGTTQEVYRNNSSGSTVTTPEIGIGVYDYTIMRVGYLPIRVVGFSLVTTGTIISVEQEVDGAYVVSSGLTYPSDSFSSDAYTINGTSTSFRNFYSYWVKTWIEETSFANTLFPITATSAGNSAIFDMGTSRIIINGTLNHEPDSDAVIMSHTGSTPSLTINYTGMYTYGSTTVVDGKTRYSSGVGLTFVGRDTASSAVWNLGDYGSIYINGGTVIMRGGLIVSDRGIGFYNNYTIDIVNTKFIKQGTNTRRELRFDEDNNGSGTFKVIVDGFQISSRKLPDIFEPVFVDCEIVQLALYSVALTPLRNLDTSSNIAVNDLGTDDHASSVKKFYVVTNASSGSGTRTMPKNDVGNFRQLGGSIIKKSISFEIVDEDTLSAVGIQMYMIDNDNGYRKNANGQDYSSSISYSGTSDGSGLIPSLDITTAITNIDSEGTWAYSDWDTTNYSNRYKVDRRGIDDTNNDIFIFEFYAYGYAISINKPSLKGISDILVKHQMIFNAETTQPDKVLVDQYTAIDTSKKLKDIADSFLEDHWGEYSDYLVLRAGDLVNLKILDLAIDPLASLPFSLVGNLITIKCLVYVGDIETTGSVTLLNEATHQGILNGKYYVKDGDVLTENYDHLYCEGSMDFTLSGLVFRGVIEVVGAGTVNVDGIGGALASVATKLETSGTINFSSELVPTLGDFTISWDGSNVLAQVNNGTQASPNLASQLADSIRISTNPDINSRATRSGLSISFTELDIRGNAGSWFKWDDDSTTSVLDDFMSHPSVENSTDANNGASMIFGYRSIIKMSTGIYRNDQDCYLVHNGGTVIFLRDATGINPLITKDSTARNDFPTLNRDNTPASIQMEGLSYIVVDGTTSSQKWYFGTSRNIGGLDKFKNLALSGGGEIFQTFQTSYETPFIPGFTIGGENAESKVEINNGSFGVDGVSSDSFGGSWRRGRYFINSPLFPVNPWNGVLSAGAANGYQTNFCVRFNQKITFSDGINGIENALVRVETIVRSAGSSYDLSALSDYPQDQFIDFTTTSEGVYQADLIDTLKARNNAGQGDSNGSTESYQYTTQVRKYEYISPRYVFQDRNYGVGGLLGDAEDVFIMTLDEDATLTEVEVQALTSIDSTSFYSALKEYWVNSDNFQSAMYGVQSGNKITLGSYDLTLDSAASVPLTIVGNTITIKCLVYEGDIETTGLVTYLNGSSVDGVVTDQTGTTGLPGMRLTGLPENAKVFITGQPVQLADGTGIVSFVLSPTTSYAVLVAHPSYKEKTLNVDVSTDEISVDASMEIYTVKNNLTVPSDANFSFTESAGVITITDTDGEFIVQNLVKSTHQYNYDDIDTTRIFGIFNMILPNYVEVSRDAQLIESTSPLVVTNASIRKTNNTDVFSSNFTIEQVSGG
jgi:hypothetical protein